MSGDGVNESHVWPVGHGEPLAARLRDGLSGWLTTSTADLDPPRRPPARERRQWLNAAVAKAAPDLAAAFVDSLLDGARPAIILPRRGGRSLLRRQIVDELLTRLDDGDQALAEDVPSGQLSDDEFARQLARLVPAAARERCRRDGRE